MDLIKAGYWQKYNTWDFVKGAATQRDGTYSPAATTTDELEVGTAVAKIDLNTHIEPMRKLWGFFCEGLMSRSLSSWISVLISNLFELDNWYYKDSILRMFGVELVEALKPLDGLPFNLKYCVEVV